MSGDHARPAGAARPAREASPARPTAPGDARPSGGGRPAPGPVVAVCAGHRCAGLRRLGGGEVLDEQLRATVRATAGGVLISSPCLDRCEHGPVTVVGHHDGTGGTGGTAPGGTPTPLVWLSEPDDPAWRAALRAWVAAGATPTRPDGAHPVVGVPARLRAAVVGYSPGASVRRLDEPPNAPAGG